MKKIMTLLTVVLMTIVGAFAQPAEHTYRNLTEGDVARLLDGLTKIDLETLEVSEPAIMLHWYGHKLIYNEDTAFFEDYENNSYEWYNIYDNFRTYDSNNKATIVYGLYWTSETEARYILGIAYTKALILERVWSVSVDDMSKVLNYLMYADMIKATDKSDNPDVRTYIELCRNSVGL